MKSSATAFFLSFIVILLGFQAPVFAQNLNLEKNNYAPGEVITVNFTAPNYFPDNAWVGVIPSQVPHGSESQNDKYDLAYQYLKKRSYGSLVFKAPAQPGSYDIRMHDTDSNGKEVASVSFTVGAAAGSSGGQSPLRLEKTAFAPGETITVHFTAPGYFPDNAWIGIIPSQVPHGNESQNDKYDLAYQYLKKRTSGSMVFKAPSQPGSYDIRMHDTDNNGKEVASVSFNVGPEAGGPAAQSPLRLDKVTFAPGEKITVHFTTPAVFPPDAWIGLIPSQAPHGSESENDKYDLAYQYMEGKSAGSLVFPAPAKPGSYDFRMHDTDNNGREVASVTFTVGGVAAAAQSQGPLRLDKASFKPGEQIVVHFTAPGGFANNAWIGIIPSNVPHGSESENDKYDLSYQYLKGRTMGSLAFRAPSQPGSYDFRMHNTDKNGKETASVTFSVQ